VVIDELGKPVAGAKVSFLAEKVPANQANQRMNLFFETDSSGHFDAAVPISNPGEYFVFAMKRDGGYPDDRIVFYADRQPSEIVLDCGTSRSAVIVQLGPKAAYIRHISVVDADRGNPVGTAGITLRRLSPTVPGLPLEAFSIRTGVNPGTDFGIAVPSKVDISYEISSPGYQTSPKKMLHLKPSEKLDIEVKLRRAPQAPGQSP
jgi:hypothetical protein